MKLPPDHPTAVAFLDETGAIARDRFFAVGCLKLTEPSLLARRLQRLRDQRHYYDELHWLTLTRSTLALYKKAIDVAADCAGTKFSCFITDRNKADPIRRFGSPWRAYEKLAAQLLIGSIVHDELISVLADFFSTPRHVNFEMDVRTEVNQRLGRCAVATMCRVDSRTADPLQVVDLLTSAVAFEHRQAHGLASETSAKAELAEHVRQAFGVASFLNPPVLNRLVNVRMYRARNTSGS